MAPPEAPTFSVIVPAHDAAHTLGPCLEAVFGGGLEPGDEVIVVDDGSADNTAAVAGRFPCQLLSPGDTAVGAAVARNRGARQARGSHLIFCDADVLPPAGWRAALADEVEANPWAGGICTFPSDDPPLRDFFSAYKQLFIHHTYRRQAPGEMNGVYSSFFCIRRELFADLDGFSERFSGASFEDLDLGLRAGELGIRILLSQAAQWRHLHRYSLASSLANDFNRARGYLPVISRAVGLRRLLGSRRPANNAGPFLGINLLLCSGMALLPGAAGPLLAAYLVHNRDMLRLLARVGGKAMAARGAAWGVVDYLVMSAGVGVGLVQAAAERVQRREATGPGPWPR